MYVILYAHRCAQIVTQKINSNNNNNKTKNETITQTDLKIRSASNNNKRQNTKKTNKIVEKVLPSDDDFDGYYGLYHTITYLKSESNQKCIQSRLHVTVCSNSFDITIDSMEFKRTSLEKKVKISFELCD